MTRLTPAGLVIGPGRAADLAQGVRSAVNLLGTTPATAGAVDNGPKPSAKLAVTP
jgi:hypothetical protein